jgi:hypothetical protein
VSDIGLLAITRAALPSFPGASYQEKLQNGNAIARAVLQKYVTTMSFDVSGAETVLRQVEAWEDRNSSGLEAAFSDASMETLTTDIQLALSTQTAQAYVVAIYTRAAYGLGPWNSSAITTISPTWAQADAETRLQVFGAIVKMDQDGFLAQLFAPSSPEAAASGFGGVPVAAIVIAVVLLAAIFATLIYAERRLDANNRLMQSLCATAQQRGDAATVAACLDATKDLQMAGLFPGIGSAMGVVIAVAGLGALIWLGWQFLPASKGKAA